MVAWDESRLWPAAQRAGMLRRARVALPGCPTETACWVKFERPDAIVASGFSVSTEWAIEYQHDDLPTLAERTELLLELQLDSGEWTKFKVREDPRVRENGSGFFRIAPLTREAC